jgi:hypothetical protein
MRAVATPMRGSGEILKSIDALRCDFTKMQFKKMVTLAARTMHSTFTIWLLHLAPFRTTDILFTYKISISEMLGK